MSNICHLYSASFYLMWWWWSSCWWWTPYVSKFDTMKFCLLDWFPYLVFRLAIPLRWPPELLSYHICTFSINNATAKAGETDSKLILFLCRPKCPKEDSYLALASKSFLIFLWWWWLSWSLLHFDHIHYTGCHWWLCIMVIAIINAERQLQMSCWWKIQFSRALIFCTWESEI